MTSEDYWIAVYNEGKYELYSEKKVTLEGGNLYKTIVYTQNLIPVQDMTTEDLKSTLDSLETIQGRESVSCKVILMELKKREI